MNVTANLARAEILGKVCTALNRVPGSPVLPLPPTARVAPREAGDRSAEIDLLLAEIGKLGGVARRVESPRELATALEDLIRAEGVKRATVWDTPGLKVLGVADMLATLGVEVVSPREDRRELAECDLGVTGADAALPETGTLLLRASPDRPRAVSLLPRVHLAILRPTALCADLHQALADVKGESYFVLVTGPSRTSDIELTLTIGVHGPKALYVWVLA